MKIFYAVQATGNGHISRAMVLLPYLEKYGKVDIFLSGSNSTLKLNAPVAFRSNGLSLQYTCHGSLHYRKTLKTFSWKRIRSEAKSLPLEKYDLVLNDFEAITSLACKQKNIPSIHFGHQASFVTDKTPRPDKKNIIGEWILKNYAQGTHNVGLHFEPYDSFIEPPVIKSSIWNAHVTNKNHVTVYLPSYCDQELIAIFSRWPNIKFEIFSRQAISISKYGNITLLPVDKRTFDLSLISCHGIITGAGFETPAEALYLKKNILAIPIRGQYEQLCNAAALNRLGIRTLLKIDSGFRDVFEQWMETPFPNHPIKMKSTEAIVETIMQCIPVRPQKSVYSRKDIYIPKLVAPFR